MTDLIRQSLMAMALVGVGGAAVWLAMPAGGADDAEDETVYELRTYVCHPGRLPALHARFSNHTMKLFEKHGMKNLSYWTPTDGDAASNTLIYVLEHKSRDAADASWKGFRADPDWIAARTESEKDGPIVMSVQSVFMKRTPYSK